MTFSEKLTAARKATGSRLCVGLDPDPERFPAPLARHAEDDPAGTAIVFCREIIEATVEVSSAFKPNLAFFEALGPAGWKAFEEVVSMVPSDRIVIADAKRGDIGNTARRYASAFFERLRCDAITISPYMGRDAIAPFLEYPGRCAFSLVLTSNPGADDLQLLPCGDGQIYQHVAELAVAIASEMPGTTGFVVGATRPDMLAALRERYVDVPFLVPGVGAQGGTADEVLAAAGSGPLLVNVSRSVMYASAGPDYASAAGDAARALATALAD